MAPRCSVRRIQKQKLRTRSRLKPLFSEKEFFSKCLNFLNSLKIKKVKSVPGLPDETYAKDNTRAECENKRTVNKYLATQVKVGGNCLVLDGAKARTSKRLIKAGASRVIVPNFSSAFAALKQIEKLQPRIQPHAVTLNHMVKTTTETFDIIYMDMCGFFTTGAKDDLKATIKLCFDRKLLNKGGVFGVTVCSRTRGGLVGAWGKCADWVHEHSGLNICWETSYGQFKTMFFSEEARRI